MRSLRRSDRYLTPRQARRVYDRIGRCQDVQALVEQAAIDDLLAHADFEQGRAVFEFGHGSGALAQRLLTNRLPADAHYVGVDVSPRMHRLAARRLAAFADRAQLSLSDGSLRFPFGAGGFDRFLATFVLDLLGPGDIDLVLGEAERLLSSDGRLCLTSLTPASAGAARFVTGVWERLWKLRPELVAGCRPIRIADMLNPAAWLLHHHALVTRLGVSFEVVVPAPRPTP